MFSFGKGGDADDGGGAEDDARFRHSPPFSFDSPLFELTTSFDVDGTDGFGSDALDAAPATGGFFPFFSSLNTTDPDTDSMAVDSGLPASSYAMAAFQPSARFQERPRARGPRRFQQNAQQATPFTAPYAGVQIKRELPDADDEMAAIARPSKLARLSPVSSDVSMADYSNSNDTAFAPQSKIHMRASQTDVSGAQTETKYRIGSFPVIDRGPVLDGDNAEPIEDEILQESSTEDSAAMSVASQNFSLPTLVIETQPPIEVRTRTPSEKRNFTCGVMVMGPWREAGGKFVGVELLYAPQCREGDEMPKQNILGGTKNVTIKSNGFALFDNLSMSEASTKHKEKEFCLRFTLLDKNGNKMPFSASTTPFYAFSNTKVLSRRREIALRTLSKNYGPFQGGEVMHVIGSPFIRGPSLKLIFRTPHGDVPASGLELYSETVLFFTLPAYPYHFAASQPEPADGIKVQVMVTNDGRNYSNPLDFTYTPSRKALRSYL